MDRKQLKQQYEAVDASISALEKAGITDESMLAPLHEQRQELERRIGDVAQEPQPQVRDVHVHDGDFVGRLPTEAEWEKAARNADARRYPWGDVDWDEERANIDDGKIGQPTPVGLYPKGATPKGLLDMSGNVWEWGLSRYRAYPYDPKDGLNDPDAEGYRVVRGGSWLNLQRLARCSFRGGIHPVNFLSVMGFRVVVSLANSEF